MGFNHEDTCKLHEEKFSIIEKRLDEHSEILKEHGNVYTKFLEKLTDMNENLINLTKVEALNSQNITNLTKTIEKHIETTTMTTKELAEKQDKQFEKLDDEKVDKESYNNDIKKLKQFEEDCNKRSAKEDANELIIQENNQKKKEKNKLLLGTMLGILSGIIIYISQWLLNHFGLIK